MIEEAICARVSELAGVVALVATRVFLQKLPQGVDFPAVRVSLVDDVGGYHLRGRNGLQRARVQVDAYTQEGDGTDAYAQLTALSAAIDGDGAGPAATGLAGWKGSIGSPATEVTACRRLMRFGPRYEGDEFRVLTMTQDYYVDFRA